MIIAVAGTHGAGKTTLVEDFLAAHREYVHEPEPYEWLQELYGEAFADEPSAEDFYRQLETCVERLSSYERGANVIAERSPLDFVAYLEAMMDLGRAARDCQLLASAVELAAAGMANIDLLAVLPMELRAPEDPELCTAMNDRLLELIADDPPRRAVELRGDRMQRLRALEIASERPRLAG